MLSKLFFGSFGRGPLGALSPRSSAHGKPLLIGLIDGQRRDYGQVFFSLRGEIDSEWVFADGSYIRAHQHASGARRGEERAIGRS